jgi:mannose-6-phosphate isomerase-like protein (cupin superfamily)
MRAGDCVLQPPLIRHRVMESSAGAEVVEICAPAEHITMADRSMPLPNGDLQPGRDFDGQQFVFHVAAQGTWTSWRVPGFEARDTGIGQATAGLAGVRVVRPTGLQVPRAQAHGSEFCFYFVLAGSVTLQAGGKTYRLAPDDSINLPDGLAYTLSDATGDLELLEVTLPSELTLASA